MIASSFSFLVDFHKLKVLFDTSVGLVNSSCYAFFDCKTKMRPKVPQIDQKSWLVISLPDIGDTFLPSVDLEEFHERVRNFASSPLMQKILDSGLVEAATFPPTVSCPKLQN